MTVQWEASMRYSRLFRTYFRKACIQNIHGQTNIGPAKCLGQASEKLICMTNARQECIFPMTTRKWRRGHRTLTVHLNQEEIHLESNSRNSCSLLRGQWTCCWLGEYWAWCRGWARGLVRGSPGYIDPFYLGNTVRTQQECCLATTVTLERSIRSSP